MENMNEKAKSAVKELVQFVNDGIDGYKKAAEETKDDHIKSFCLSHAEQRSRFASELNNYLGTLGAEAETDNTIKGSLYHQWMDLKATFTGNDDEAIIKSCEYGEEWALKAYDEALACELPLDVKSKIQAQRSAVQEAYNELKEMEQLHHH
jgi:uncharacterized protein (TIGR02284 family)